MNLDEGMLSELDSFDWFADGEEIWGDLAYQAYTSQAFAYLTGQEYWMKYVNQLKLLQSRALPSNEFCQRLALWLDGTPASRGLQVSDLTDDDLLTLFVKGRLARLDAVKISDENYSRAVKWVVSKKLWIGRGVEYALVYELLNHPQTGSTRLKFFVQELARGANSTRLVALSVIANHPAADAEILSWVAASFYEAGSKAHLSELHPLPDQLANTLHERRDLLSLKWRSKHKNPTQADMRLFYLGEQSLDRRLLTSSYEDICHEAWWQNLFYSPSRAVAADGGFRPYGTRLEAGPQGMPPAVPLLFALKFLDAVERDDYLDEKMEPSTGLWTLPYLQGTKRWLREQFGTGDIPTSWMLETLGVSENLNREEWNILSPGWLSQADKRISLGLP